MENKTDLKCVIVGHTFTGKTCLFNRICQGIYDPHTSATTGFCGVKQIPISIDEQEHPVQMSLWDTIGQDRFMTPTRQFTRGASAAMICCSLSGNTDYDLEKAKFWTHIFLKDSPECKLYLVGTKCDLEKHPANEKKMIEYADQYNAHYMETSSKEDINISQLVKKVASDWAVNQSKRTRPVQPMDALKLDESSVASGKTNRGCCN